MNKITVSGLWIYPVKSCRGISLTEMKIGEAGPLFDRQWMIVDKDNQFLTLRTTPKLAEVKTSIQGQFLHLYTDNNKILVDTAKNCETSEVVTVWGDQVTAGVENKSINEALSDFLSQTVKLVRYQKDSFRNLGSASTDVVKEVMFADSRPILLTNEASLNDLNQKLLSQGLEPSVMERFRPNIIIKGLNAFEEDQFKNWKISEVSLENSKLCARCPVVTQEVETGKVVSKETLQILSSYRKVQGGNKVMFGVNLTPAKLGTIKIGDLVYTA